MRRRDFITFLAGAMTAWPLPAGAQQPATPVIGFLSSASAESFAPLVAAFRDGLKEAGYVEGRNVAIEFAWAAGQYDKLPTLAEDLVRRPVAVIVAAGGAVAALAAKAATSTIPIVISIGDDPVQYGLVGSFNHPGGNITGVTLFMATLTPKRLEILSEVAPAAALAILINPRNPNAESEAENAQAAARQLGRELRVLTASTESDIDAAFASIAQQLSQGFGVAVAAALLALTSHGAAIISTADFSPVFIIVGLLSLGTMWGFLRLTPEDGALVTGAAASVVEATD